jgi:uncharacterized protein (DUF697 family)
MKPKKDLLNRLDQSLDRKPRVAATAPAPKAGPAPAVEKPAATAITVMAYPVHVREEAVEIVTRFALLSAATPLIPIPVLDSVAVSGVQLAMISELCKRYGQDYSKNVAQSLVGAGGAGLLSLFFSNSAPGRALKNAAAAIPLIGPIVRWGTGPVVLAGYTWILGLAFIQHFEMGGKFADFDRKQFAAYVQRVAKEHLNPGEALRWARPFFASS